MSKRLYVAYGSNLNKAQMAMRCKTSKFYGTGVIQDYELQFKGAQYGAYATIAPKPGAFVPVAVWEIEPQDEKHLDRYEGYPSHYFKQDVSVQIGGEEIHAMVYVMNLKMRFGMPAPYYYQTVYEGYKDCGLDTNVLNQAVRDSMQAFYANCRDDETLSELEIEDEDDEYPDEDDTFSEDESDVPDFFNGITF